MITYDRPMTVDIDQCRGTRILFLTIALSVALPCLAQTPEAFEVRRAEAAFEELPVLNASEILRPEFLSGPYHKVREPVPTYFGANQFTGAGDDRGSKFMHVPFDGRQVSDEPEQAESLCHSLLPNFSAYRARR